MVVNPFGPPEQWPDQDLLAFTDDIDPAFALVAYQYGVFPMPLDWDGSGSHIGWWSPVKRGILRLDSLRVTRSLRQSVKHYQTTFNTACSEVISRCADPNRPDGWITAQIRDCYQMLHKAGYVHSVEVWRDDDLVGGLYGVEMGGLFAGESMFHDPVLGRDASKVALWTLVDSLKTVGGDRLVDVQWLTPHLASLGAIEIPRMSYLEQLPDVLRTHAVLGN